jgi:hypothetical protein
MEIRDSYEFLGYRVLLAVPPVIFLSCRSCRKCENSNMLAVLWGPWSLGPLLWSSINKVSLLSPSSLCSRRCVCLVLSMYTYWVFGALLACVNVRSVWTLCRKHYLLRCLEQLLTLSWIRNRRVTRSPLRARLSSRLRRRLSRSPPRCPLFHPQDIQTNLDVAVYKTGHWALYLVPPHGRLNSLHQVNNNSDGRGYYVGPTRLPFSRAEFGGSTCS